MTVTEEALRDASAALLDRCRASRLKLVTAESLTGGLIAATVSSVAGASDVLERALVVYSWDAKTQLLGVPRDLIERDGAVAESVARAMALGALNNSHPFGSLSVAVTGVAGPGPSEGKPAGRVHLAAARRGVDRVLHLQRDYGEVGRAAVRLATVADALALALSLA